MQKNVIQENKEFEKLLMLKEELFAKKKQFYLNENKISLLEEKIKQYKNILDYFESYLNKGDRKTL